MARPEKKQLDKLKKQDKELEHLPSMKTEKKVFKKGESLLDKWTKPKKVKFDLKQLSRSKKENIKKIKSKAGKKSRSRYTKRSQKSG
jgi:hypothetical protein